jgi:RNA polymerase sigma-70 factor, ECF subfamily
LTFSGNRSAVSTLKGWSLWSTQNSAISLDITCGASVLDTPYRAPRWCEAYLRLVDGRPFDTGNRAHFLAVAPRLMRQILVDYARIHGSAKRGQDRLVELDTSVVLPQVRSSDLVALDDALNDLTSLDEQQGRIVELRFFGWLATEEVAAVLDISSATVQRDWNVAKALLIQQLRKGNRGDTRAVAKN